MVRVFIIANKQTNKHVFFFMTLGLSLINSFIIKYSLIDFYYIPFINFPFFLIPKYLKIHVLMCWIVVWLFVSGNPIL
ncbi:hypothetical protein BDF14DRAFT_579942 [Spinellus fusiger]|nr:hypothetical protein BDF14DRAFT_579942 [Spinellus fusiger]